MVWSVFFLVGFTTGPGGSRNFNKNEVISTGDDAIAIKSGLNEAGLRFGMPSRSPQWSLFHSFSKERGGLWGCRDCGSQRLGCFCLYSVLGEQNSLTCYLIESFCCAKPSSGSRS